MANTLIDEIADELNGTVKRALDRLAVEARSAGSLTSDLAHEGGVRARKGVEFARKEVRDHPARSIAIGVAVGALATLLLTSRGMQRKH